MLKTTLAQLRALKALYLSDNKLSRLPEAVCSLVALEELSTLESRVVCDASESGSLPSPMSTPEDPTMLRPRDKFHTLIRADSLNNHRWQETEAKFLSAGSSEVAIRMDLAPTLLEDLGTDLIEVESLLDDIFAAARLESVVTSSMEVLSSARDELVYDHRMFANASTHRDNCHVINSTRAGGEDDHVGAVGLAAAPVRGGDD